MMRVSEAKGTLLVTSPQLGRSLLDEGLPGLVFDATEAVIVLDVIATVAQVDRALQIVGATRTPRFMDRFYFCWPCGGDLTHQAILDAFFEEIGGEYDSLVDVERNRENVRNLICLIEGEIGAVCGKHLLDFGCGTGVSFAVIHQRGANVVGFDTCSTMRRLATSRGMKVIGPKDVATLHAGAFDAIFASYVFHLMPDPESVGSLWRSLKPGGPLVANLHKNTGYEALAGCMQDLGAAERPFPGILSQDRHGRYVVFRKEG